MASQVETRNPIRQFHRRTSSRDQPMKISAPMLAFTDADNRHDLYSLQPRIKRSVTSYSVRPTRSKLKKKIHISDLSVGQNSVLPVAPPTSFRKPVQSPTAIGIALKSPTYWPSTQPYAGRGSLDSRIPAVNNTPIVASDLQSTGGLNRESRRKLFPSIFGKKNSVSSRDEFHIVQPSQISPTLVAFDNQQKADPKLERMPSTAKAAPSTPWNQELNNPLDDMRPRLNKSVTMPFEYPSRPPSPPPKDFPPRPLVFTRKPSQNCPNCTPISPMLKVNIPDIKMERYSVMFKDVLKPRQSLLARRHAQLKELQIANTSIPEVPQVIPESAFESEAHNPSSQPAPKIPLPERPNIGLGISQRTGLSRSNTLPNTTHQPQTLSTHPKRTDSHITRARSPSHGSETPTSTHSEWPSQQSPEASDTSDSDADDDMCENIIIQFEDISLPHNQPVHRGPGYTAELQDNPTPPLRTKTAAQTAIKPKYTLTPPHTSTPREDSATLPPAHHITQSIIQAAATASRSPKERPFRHLNPLKSSPASPTEITTARQLSWSRSQQVAIVRGQPRVTVVAHTGSVSELRTRNAVVGGAC